MKKKNNENDLINYRLEKINKIKKNPIRKGFARFFDDKNTSINSSNIENGSMSSKIFNKSVNKKNVTLRMLDFEQDYTVQMGIEQNDELNTRIKYLSFLIYIISFIIYKQSLFNCDNLSLNECIDKYNVNIAINCFIKCVLSGLILSVNIAFIFWKLLSMIHIFLLLIVIILLLLLDYRNDIYGHGIINFIILFISLIFGFLFCIIIQMIINTIKKKNYKISLFLNIIVIIAISGFIFLYLIATSCNYWNKGLKNRKIDNDKNKYSCKIISPSKCYINAFDKIFDFSEMRGYKCDNMPNEPSYSETLDNYNLYYDTQFDGNTSVLNFPLTNNGNFSGDEFNFENNFARKVITNIKGSIEKDINNSEIFLVKKGKEGNIEMNIKKNNTLVQERVKLSNTSNKIRNIIFIYFDSLSRQQLHRKLRSVSGFLSDIYDNAHQNYESFEFLKYHTFNNYNTHQSIQTMFYGADSLFNNYDKIEEKPLHILSHLKQNGYITAQSANICSKKLSSNYYESFQDEFDHENIAMFCDPNYFITNPKTSNIKGIHSSIIRCLYGKNTFEYVLDYGKNFWETYSDSNKFLRLGFFDGNEKSGEVINYLDDYLINFIIDLINSGKFYKTILFLASGKGEIEMGIFHKNKKSEFFYEKNLGSFFIILNKYGIDDEILQKIRNNMQTFVTPYDIYDSMLSVIYNCYDLNCDEKIKHKSSNGNSIFNNINGYERNCEKYKEIKDNGCHCKKY